MPRKKELRTISLVKMMDKHLGKIGTPKRDRFEYELRLDIGKKSK